MTPAVSPDLRERPGLSERTMALFGEAGVLRTTLLQAGFRACSPAALLINAGPHPDLGTFADRCQAFAAALPAGNDGLIVTIVPPYRKDLEEWRHDAAAAGLLRFTKQAALAWGPRHIRVNMIEAAPDAPDADIAAAILALFDLPCVTGQSWHLGS